MQEKNNVLDILNKTKEALKKEDVVDLKDLSNRTIHTASISQDPDNIALAVIVYSLGKIIERKKYRGYRGWNGFYKTYTGSIERLIVAIKKDDEREIDNNLGRIRKSINSLSGHLKKYIQDVFRKASINKASRIYEHGISMEQTATLLGISMFELAEYAGSTGIADVNLAKTLDVKQRIKLAMEMFR